MLYRQRAVGDKNQRR